MASLSVNGEVAFSKPSPNRFGQAYIEEFEGGDARSIVLTDNAWHWSSIPTSVRGAEALGFPTSFDPNRDGSPHQVADSVDVDRFFARFFAVWP